MREDYPIIIFFTKRNGEDEILPKKKTQHSKEKD